MLLAFSNPLVNDPSTDTDTNVNAHNTQSETSTFVIPGSGTIAPTVWTAYNDTGSKLVGNGRHNIGYAISTDGGASFVDQGTLPDTTNDGESADPVLARSDSGTTYFASNSAPSVGPILTQVSWKADSDSTWTHRVSLFSDGSHGTDKPWMTVDNYTTSGTGHGNVYVAADRFFNNNEGDLMFAQKSPTDSSFGTQTLIAHGTNEFFHGVNIVVDPDHLVHVFYLNNVLDGDGVTWHVTLETRVSNAPASGQLLQFGSAVVIKHLDTTTTSSGELGLGTFKTKGFPTAVVNPTNAQQLFVVFASRPTSSGTDRADIMMFQSSDGGATWNNNTETPIVVNDDGTTNDQYLPTLAIKPDGSQLFVGWYERRNDPSNNLIDVYGRVGNVSSAGVAFQDSFRISNTSWAPYNGFDNGGGFGANYMGDYDTAAADNTGFYYSWGDNRNAHAYATDNQGANVRLQRIPSVFGTNSTSKGDSIVVQRSSDGMEVQVLVNTNLVFHAPYNVTDQDHLTPTIVIDGGDGNDTISGDAAVASDLIIYGGAGNDVITGGSGNDTIYGGDGADNIQGGAGNDSIDGGAGVDTLNGYFTGQSETTESNTVSYATRTNGFGVDLSASPQSSSEDGFIFNFENVTGSLGSDSITGNNGANMLDGWQNGADSINGNDGDDAITVYGANINATNTTVIGGLGSDTLNYIDSNQTQTSNTYSHSVSSSTATIAHSGFRDVQYGNNSFESVVMNTFGATDTTTVSSTFSGTPVAVNGGGAADTININVNGSVGAVAVVTVDGGSGLDTVQVNGNAYTEADFPTSQDLALLQITNGGTAKLQSGGDKLLTITNDTTNHGLDLGTGKLDLTDEDMIVYSTAANLKPDIQALINNARNNGTQGQWSGSGITSTSAKNEPHQNGTLGVLNNVEFVNVIPFVSGERGFDGTKVTNSTSAPAVLVKYTYYGDTDFNGKVDFDDYVRTDNAYNNHIADGGWLNGDFDGDGGLVDFDDYVLIDLGFNTQSGIRAPHSWADVAQMDHFPQEGYEQYLIDALAQLGIHVTDQDFHP